MRPITPRLATSLATIVTAFGPTAALAHSSPRPVKTRRVTKHHTAKPRHPTSNRDQGSVVSLSADYAVFGHPPRPLDQAPGGVVALAALANANPSRHAGVDSADARRLGTGPAVYLLPAETGDCAVLLVPAGATNVMACNDVAHQDFITSTTFTPSGWLVWGAAADGITSVTVTMSDGQTSEVPVTTNGFAHVFPENPALVEPVGTAR